MGVLAVLVALVVLSVGAAGTAAAHPTLLFTDPPPTPRYRLRRSRSR
jgi:Tfp pilus assembly protein PilV